MVEMMMAQFVGILFGVNSMTHKITHIKFFLLCVFLVISVQASDKIKYNVVTRDLLESSNFLPFNNTLFFISQDSYHGREVWETNGSFDGTRLSVDVNFGNPSSNPNLLFKLHNQIFFTAYDYEYGSMLWVSDGTQKNSFPLAEVSPTENFIVVGDTLFFTIKHYSDGHIIWSTNGTRQNTKQLNKLNIIAPLLNFEDTLYFISGNNNQSYSIWKNDPLKNEPTLIDTIESNIALNTTTNDVISTEGQLFLKILLATNKHELLVSNGKKNTTTFLNKFLITTKLYKLKNKIYFMASHDNGEKGLWVSDGTIRGTKMIKKLDASVNGEIVATDTQLFFKTFDFIHGNEFWTSDGTEEGTILLKRFESVSMLHVFKNKIYFLADDDTYGMELWVSDGSKSGTYMLNDYAPGKADSKMNIVALTDDKIYVSLNKKNKKELWSLEILSEDSVEKKVYDNIIEKRYELNGAFSSYDFINTNEKFDWVFTDIDDNCWQLQGIESSEKSIFGWKKVSIKPGKAVWYMLQLKSDIDQDGSLKFDWLLLFNSKINKKVYKLMGATSDGVFSYSNAIGVNYTISDDKKSVFFNK
jgi:ELWxxDGT repeat protein